MTYLVFILIVAAALVYLFLSDARSVRQQTTGNNERNRLAERLDAIKLSLRDIEYEKTVGKMDVPNFTRLQNELLTEWDNIERQLEALPKDAPAGAASCPQCGTAVAALAAKFCHACGSKLSLWLFALALLFTLPETADAFDIHVTVQNGTAGSIETAPLSVQLLKLEQGMQPVTAKTTSGGQVEFNGLPEMTAGPYMVQAVYRGVTYSRAIPPNMASPADVKLEIFEATASTDKLRVRTLVELRRITKDALAGVMVLFFVNNDRRAFTGGAEGLEFYLPPAAQIEQASISVGSGASNIQWLKLSPKPGAEKGRYSVGQNVKPGERILQIMFRMPYDEKGTALRFQSIYPHSEDRKNRGVQLIAEPDDIEVRQGGKTLTRMRDEGLGRSLISFPVNERQIEVSLARGGIAEAKKNEEVELEIKSPLSLTEKLLFPVLAIFAFASGIWLKGRLKTRAR